MFNDDVFREEVESVVKELRLNGDVVDEYVCESIESVDEEVLGRMGRTDIVEDLKVYVRVIIWGDEV